jgi:drug resistance transporter, Bcr/CflA subfamily
MIKKTNGKNSTNNMMIEQKYLGRRGMIAFIVVMNMFGPFSTDMYLPAFPSLVKSFGTTAAMMDLTLLAFFFFFSMGMLIFGPVSDKYGRRPLLIFGAVTYMAGSAGCFFSSGIWMLIIFRVVQGIGAGAMVSVSTALIKDIFSEGIRGRMIGIVQTFSAIGPMLAPVAGGLILKVATWRTTFAVLIAVGLLCTIAALLTQETIPAEKRFNGSLGGSIGRLFFVLNNKSFAPYLLSAALLNAPFMSYLSLCSFIYQNDFGLSAQAYSLFFAANAGFSLCGPLLYIRLMGKMPPRNMNRLGFGAVTAGSVLLFFFGSLSPWMFFVSFALCSVFISMMRPLSTAILLEQQEGDTGSASSLINFSNTMLGCIGMIISGFRFFGDIRTLAAILIVFTAAGVVIFAVLMRSDIEIKHLK